MRTSGLSRIGSAVATVALAAGPAAAQPDGRGEHAMVWVEGGGDHQTVLAGPGGDFVFDFVATEQGADQVVQGAPYSAEAVTEFVQTLADGNRIVRTSRATMQRDSAGRTRREQTEGALLPAAAAWGGQTILLQDPVAGTSYVLDPERKVARRLPPLVVRHAEDSAAGTVWSRGDGAAAGTGSRVTIRREGSVREEDIEIASPAGERGVRIVRRIEGPHGAPDDDPARVDPLGQQTIAGVVAEGTRSTRTIPAGAVGNEQPIEIVSERWFSPELKLLVLSRHSDPRIGETTYRLTNVNRAEPAASLFQVPSDYRLVEPEVRYFDRRVR